MDRATQEYRRRMKAENGPRGQLPSIGPRAYGRKNKVERTANKQCTYRIGGKKKLIARRRKTDNTLYHIPLILGGIRCPNDAISSRNGTNRCLEHLGKEQ